MALNICVVAYGSLHSVLYERSVDAGFVGYNRSDTICLGLINDHIQTVGTYVYRIRGLPVCTHCLAICKLFVFNLFLLLFVFFHCVLTNVSAMYNR